MLTQLTGELVLAADDDTLGLEAPTLMLENGLVTVVYLTKTEDAHATDRQVTRGSFSPLEVWPPAFEANGDSNPWDVNGYVRDGAFMLFEEDNSPWLGTFVRLLHQSPICSCLTPLTTTT